MRGLRKSICRAPLRTLAVLLLMDGEPVSAPWIARVLGYRADFTVRCHLATLKEHGVWQIVTRNRRHRLVGLPPDELLPNLLREVDTLKQSEWWAMQSTYQRHRAASRAS